MLLVVSCSTQKNTWVNRAYHNLTSRYNIYFNGKESLKEGLVKINHSVEDDYSKLLLIHKSSDPGTGQTASSEMETAILKASKLIKMRSITQKPKRRKNRTRSYKKLASKEEYNNWVDDSYLLMGQAYFYMKNYIAAIENFSYIVRKFSDEEIKHDAYVWLIRAYTEMERYNEALETIQHIDGQKEFPKRLNNEFGLAVADFHIRQNEYTEAIPHLKSAIKGLFFNKNKARYKYILGQLYKETGNNTLASETFREVAKMNPSYSMAFNARINAAGTFTGDGDIQKLKKELRKMLRDFKNFEYRDQIYYALADIYMAENNKSAAIDLYIRSATASNVNMFQRAISCLTIADIYFDERNYKGAQSYYDSAMVVIDEEYPNYEVIQRRHQSLSRLVENLYTVEKEDSLQRIALLSESERNELVSRWTKEAQEEEERLRQLENAQRMDQSFFRMNQNRFGLGRQQQGAGWYFYNPTTVTYGKSEFEQIWGKRKLEDNWRRSNRTSGLEEELITLEGEQEASQEGPKRIEDPKNREYYLQDVPLTHELMAASHDRIRDALFNAGRIFKQDYSNYERSIASYEDLNKRYPENIYQLTTYFELWDLYKRTNNLEQSNYYRNLVTTNFPETKYARYLINPNYFIELEAREDSLNNLYQLAFYNYKHGNYQEAVQLVQQMNTMEPDSLLKSKIDFIDAVSKGTQTSLNNFGDLLTAYLKNYPESEPAPLAGEILALIADSTLADYQKLVEIGYLNETIQNEELKEKNLAENDEFGGKFSYEEDLLHYFVIAFPRNENVDINRLKFDIANYNIDHYTKQDFDIETENLTDDQVLLIVRSLKDKEQALIYFRSIIRKREVFETLKDVEYMNFVTSSTNYRGITSDRNYMEYLKFFVKNYSRFINNDFPEDELPDPEELMAKSQEEQLEERGTFVVVKTNTDQENQEAFEKDFAKKQNFVLAVKDARFDLRLLMRDFADFNRDEFSHYSLTMQQRAFDDYQLLVIKPLPNTREGMDYFSNVVANRRLFENLGTRSYRNFIISDQNLNELIANKTLDEYIQFFREYHIRGNYTNDKEVIKEVESVPEQMATKPVVSAEPLYQGVFKTDVEGKQRFILIVPVEGVDKTTLRSAIENLNDQQYSSLPLQLEEFEMGTESLVLSVSGLQSKTEGMQYLQNIIQNQQIYNPLMELNYRNFIISDENFKIFLENKNISDYMELFKIYYLNNP